MGARSAPTKDPPSARRSEQLLTGCAAAAGDDTLRHWGDRLRHPHNAVQHTRSLLRRSDERLVVRAARGDDSPLAELYDRHTGVAYGPALRVLRDPSLAEAVVEEAFRSVAAVRGAPAARGPGARTSLLALVHRKAVDASRGRPDLPSAQPRLDEEPEAQTAGGAASEHDRYRRALGQLPDDQRQTLELAYYDGLCMDELADRLGQSRAGVCETLRAGLFRLQEVLEEPAAASSAPAPEPERAPRRESDRHPRRTGSFSREQASRLTFGDGSDDDGRRA